MPQNLRVNVRRTNNYLTDRFGGRENLQPGSYNELQNVRPNYLSGDILSHAQRHERELRRNQEPIRDENWLNSHQFFEHGMAIANRFNISGQPAGHMQFNRGFGEFIVELERTIQRRVLNREYITRDQTHAQQAEYSRAMADSIQTMVTVNRGDVQSLNEMTTVLNTFNANFFDRNGERNGRYMTSWSPDFRHLIDDVIRMIKNTFSPNPNMSYFGELIPYLQRTVAASPRRGSIYRMGNDQRYLRIIMNICMLRLPTLNTNKRNNWTSFQIPIMLDRLPTEIGSAGTISLSTVTIEHTDTSLKNMFYYIPEQDRVLGIWPKSVQANRGLSGGDGLDRSTVKVDFNSSLIRSVLGKIILSREDIQSRSRINFHLLFENSQDNLYSRIRRMNPFGLPAAADKWKRLFVSITFFSESNDKILHIPWTIESTDRPIDGVLDNDREHIAYDMSELLRVIQLILEGKISGRTDEEDDGRIIWFIIQFINENPYYNEANLQILEEGEEEEKKDDLDRPVQFIREDDDDEPPHRRARTQQTARPSAPTKNSPNLEGVYVGAPYAGTLKERLFLKGSMLNRFTMSDALFETPETPRTYGCFMMALIRAQLYKYTYNVTTLECTDVLVTNGQRANMSCDGIYVQAVNDFSDALTYPFIEKVDGEVYIKLFNNTKYMKDGKHVAGCRDEKEQQYWELAADEIWLHLERMRGRAINYNDLGDYGQAFADMFNVCISIYDIEVRGTRVCVISPNKKSPLDLAKEGEINMIHLVFDQGHMHAVNNLRKFIQSKDRATEVRQYHYCPICDQKQTRELTLSNESALLHITTCTRENDEKFLNGYKKEEEYRMESQYCQVKKEFKKIKGKSRMVYQCTQCHQEVEQLSYQCHVCTIQKKKLENLPEQKIYVWDVEAAQLSDDFGLLKHECNCVYIKQVYTDAPARYFPTEIEFIEALMNESEFQNAVFLAHNGGSYDIHFLMRIFERLEIAHTYTPSPTSRHKFIAVKITGRDVMFLDFMRFMPGSLRGIGESFEIDVSKGDFPYKFNNGEHDSYIGPIPPIDTEQDWWGLNEARSKKQVDGFKKWYEDQLLIYCHCRQDACECQLKKWDFQEELKKYCELDVIVLAKITKAYRDKVMGFQFVKDELYPNSSVTWQISQIDPFQFMTLPQITMQTLVHGFGGDSFVEYGFNGITSHGNPERASRSEKAILWLKRLAILDDVMIVSRENSLREFYDFELKMSFDGYCYTTNTVYLFLKCSFWGCPHCMREYHESPNGSKIIPERGISAKDAEEFYHVTMKILNDKYTVKSIWEHNFDTSFFDPYYLKCAQQMRASDCFYGGRTEVFKLYANAEKFPEDEFKYFDVTSLYPSVYAHRKLPVGTPKYIIGYNVDKNRLQPDHPERYFGYCRIKVKPVNTDQIGLLPQRDPQTQRLTFPVHEMEGCWFTEEIYLAMENGYVVEEVYEMYHWEPNQQSDQHLRGYVGYFLQMKQESEGWLKLGASCAEPTLEEQNEIAIRLYHQNGGLARIRPEKVKVDPVMRALAKLYLNSLWGKWAQKTSKEEHGEIFGAQQLEQVFNDLKIDRDTLQFRETSPGVYKYSCKKKNPYIKNVPHGNIWLAAAVTAWARITLHKMMIKVNQLDNQMRIFYCDTDSIIFRWPKNGPKLSGIGLGHWTDEYPKNVILKFYALAPKLYALVLGSKSAPDDVTQQKESFRAKGVQMTLANQTKMGFENILPLIQRTIEDKAHKHIIEVNNFSIFTNSTNNALPFGSLYSRYNMKGVRVIITKRIVDPGVEECNFEFLNEIATFPPGYCFENTN